MAQLIFKTKHAPEEECMEIRRLLVDNEIIFHETGAGLLGISIPGLWVDDEFAKAARELIEKEQSDRQLKIQQDYQENPKSILDMFKSNPIKFLGSILAVAALLSLVVLPFMYFKI